MHAKFFGACGTIGIFNDQGEEIIHGCMGSQPGEDNFHPMLEYAIALMKHNGDWPDNPYKAQVIDLIDESTQCTSYEPCPLKQ